MSESDAAPAGKSGTTDAQSALGVHPFPRHRRCRRRSRGAEPPGWRITPRQRIAWACMDVQAFVVKHTISPPELDANMSDSPVHGKHLGHPVMFAELDFERSGRAGLMRQKQSLIEFSQLVRRCRYRFQADGRPARAPCPRPWADVGVSNGGTTPTSAFHAALIAFSERAILGAQPTIGRSPRMPPAAGTCDA